jgi:serine/threonine-protein kinase
MGTVLEARRRRDGERVALKLMHAEQRGDEATRESFRREIEALELARHPMVVRLLDHGETAAGDPFLVLEWLEGLTLQSVLAGCGALDVRRARWIFCGLLDVLGCLHGRGIVHADVKPDNIIVAPRRSGRLGLHLVDFGVASLRGQRLTRRGDVYGTPGYLAPEVIMGHAPSPGSDLYAAGIVLFQILTGRTPFHGQTMAEILDEQAQRTPPRASRFNLAVDDRMDAVIARSMAILPDNRFADAWTFRRAFREALTARGAVPASDSTRRPTRPFGVAAPDAPTIRSRCS